jgi:bifunctional non-homologous end joining protein LigD
LIVQREGSRVRLFTRNGQDWTDRYPPIVEAALKNRQNSFVTDDEAVLLGVDGISDFNSLHSRRHDDEVQLYAFDILAVEDDDLRKLPLSLRKTNLARLRARRPDDIFVASFEAGEIGPDPGMRRSWPPRPRPPAESLPRVAPTVTLNLRRIIVTGGYCGAY